MPHCKAYMWIPVIMVISAHYLSPVSSCGRRHVGVQHLRPGEYKQTLRTKLGTWGSLSATTRTPRLPIKFSKWAIILNPGITGITCIISCFRLIPSSPSTPSGPTSRYSALCCADPLYYEKESHGMWLCSTCTSIALRKISEDMIGWHSSRSQS